jgi:hypothetical protein
MPAFPSSTRLIGGAFLCVIFLAGCGPSMPRCIPVSGKVTLDGNKVPGPGYLYFTTEAKEGVSRPGTAEFDAEGNYVAKTFVPGDGLMPGKYLLRVDCWKVAPNMDGKPTVSYIAPKYQNAATSELELTVDANARTVTYDVKLTSK